MSQPTEAGLIRGVEITTANVHDAAELEAVLPLSQAQSMPIAPLRVPGLKGVIRGRGGTPRTCRRASGADQRHWRAWRRTMLRCGACERGLRRCSALVKRSYGLRRMRWLGLAKAGLQVRLAAMAYNLRRSWRLLALVPA